MKHLQYIFLLLATLSLSGCLFQGTPVRHLASEASMIAPEKTTKTEVLSYLGQPSERQTIENGDEMWVYHQVNKSVLRDTPYVGEKIGTENYDVVTVTFMGDMVTTCVYRMLTEEEFNNRSKIK